MCVYVCVSAQSLVLSNSLQPYGLYIAHQGPLSMGFSRQEYWRVAMPSSMGSFQPMDQTHVSCGFCIAGRFFTTEPLGKPQMCVCVCVCVYCVCLKVPG